MNHNLFAGIPEELTRFTQLPNQEGHNAVWDFVRSPDNRFYVSVCGENEKPLTALLYEYYPKSGELRLIFDVAKVWIVDSQQMPPSKIHTSIDFLPDGRLIMIRICDIDCRVQIELSNSDDPPYCIFAHPIGKRIHIGLFLLDFIMQLSFVGGAARQKFGGKFYETATTFEQAERIVDELMQQGAGNIRVTYQGWQNSGYAQSDLRFPVVPELGGNQGAKRFVQAMHDKGIKVLFEDYMTWKWNFLKFAY